MKTEKEQELLKKIAYHEVYSTAYKIQLAKNVTVRGLSAGGKTLLKGSKQFIHFLRPKKSMGIKGLEWVAYDATNHMRVLALNKQVLEHMGRWNDEAQLFFNTLENVEGILARYKGKIIGSVFINAVEESATMEIHYPCVAEPWKPLGIEEAMLLEVLKTGIQNNFNQFTIKSNKHAIEERILVDTLGFMALKTSDEKLFIKEVQK